jgi:glycerol uptake facilitator-like aquaporin
MDSEIGLGNRSDGDNSKDSKPNYRASLFRFYNPSQFSSPSGSFGNNFDLSSWIGFGELMTADLWRAVLAEFVGTMIFAMLNIGFPTQTLAVDGLANGWAWWMLIQIFGPISGGHFNPLITFSTVCTGTTSIARFIGYFFAQCLGSFLSGLAISRIFRTAGALTVMPCSYYNDNIDGGQYVGFSIIFNVFVLAAIHSFGLDARQSSYNGPIYTSFAISFTLGIAIWASGSFTLLVDQVSNPTSPTTYGINWGYNPAFCFAYQEIQNNANENAYPDNLENASGLAFAGVFISSLIYAVIHYVLFVPVNHHNDLKEEADRNGRRLKHM